MSDGKKGRKVGRNGVYCARYRAEGRKRKNKIAKIRRHIRRCERIASRDKDGKVVKADGKIVRVGECRDSVALAALEDWKKYNKERDAR